MLEISCRKYQKNIHINHSITVFTLCSALQKMLLPMIPDITTNVGQVPNKIFFYEPRHIGSYSRTRLGIWIIHLVESSVFSSNNILDMNSANAIYKDILNMNEFPLVCENNQKYLETLTRETINVLTTAIIHYFSW